MISYIEGCWNCLRSHRRVSLICSRLYLELRKAHLSNRGMDAQPRWFENQIGFLESYLLPLAHRLEDTGVFGSTMGTSFAQIVENNRDKWLTEGYEATQKLFAEGEAAFPAVAP